MPAIDQRQYGDIDVSNIQKEQVRAAFIAHLPFRLCIGQLLPFHCDWVDGTYQICLHNGVSITTEEEAKEAAELSGRDRRPLWTDVLIIVEQPTLQPSDIEDISQQKQKVPHSVLFRDEDRALGVLNQVIIAYSRKIVERFGGEGVNTLSGSEFGNCLEYVITLPCPEHYQLRDEEILDLVTSKPRFHLTGLPSPADLLDVDDQLAARIPSAVHEQRDCLWYEFAFEARSNEDPRVSLVMAVIALEAVHAHLVRLELSKRLSPVKAHEPKLERFLKDLLRKQGLYDLNEVTPSLLMDEGEQPSPDHLNLCQDGIKMRNAIVHAKPKAREHTPFELREACHAVLRVYECYRRAVEARMELESATQ